MGIPEALLEAVRPVTVVVGHYGAGKTNFAVNLAIDLAALGKSVTVIDVDIVNPYFRASEQRTVLEERGVRLIAPVFAEAGTSLDVPSLTGKIGPAIQSADESEVVIIDAGGDDVGATALGRYSKLIRDCEYAVLYVANRYRNLVQDPADAYENMREVEVACGLAVSAIVNNSHLKTETTRSVVEAGLAYSKELASRAGVPLVTTTMPATLADSFEGNSEFYAVKMYVSTPWE